MRSGSRARAKWTRTLVATCFVRALTSARWAFISGVGLKGFFTGGIKGMISTPSPRTCSGLMGGFVSSQLGCPLGFPLGSSWTSPLGRACPGSFADSSVGLVLTIASAFGDTSKSASACVTLVAAIVDAQKCADGQEYSFHPKSVHKTRRSETTMVFLLLQ